MISDTVSNLPLLKALVATLISEIDSLSESRQILEEGGTFDLQEKVREFEIKSIKTALVKTGGNQRRAAALLGIKTTTLHNKIKNLNIKYLKIGS